MMSYADLSKVIPQILKSIHFHDYLLFKNYKILKDKTYKGLKCYRKDSDEFDDIIYVGNVGKEETYYSVHYNDKGNIIDFVKNRIEIEEHYINFTPEKDHLIEACKELIVYLNENGESSTDKGEETSKNDLKELMMNSFTNHYNATSVVDYNFLESLKIKKSIADHRLFQDRIFNSRGLMFNRNFYDVINMAFPIYDINSRECGLYYENFLKIEDDKKTHFEFFASHSVKTGIWMSNEFKRTANQTIALTIVDRPIEAISHFQYIKQDRRYVSVFDVEEVTLKHLTNFLNQGRTSLYLAFNVNMESFIKEIRILVTFLSLEHDIQFVQNTNKDIWLRFAIKSEKRYFERFLKRIKYHNNNKLKNVIGVLGEKSTQFIKDDMIKVSEDQNGDLTVKVPKNFKTLYRFEKILISSFPKHIPIQIEKPTHLSWKNQNKLLFDVVDNEMTLENFIENEDVFVVTSN